VKIKEDQYTVLFKTIAYVVILALTVACLVPFLLVISASFTRNEAIVKYGYRFIPKVGRRRRRRATPASSKRRPLILSTWRSRRSRG
jgi:ABC-type glycerol-3-phosphate transport system permease component